MILFHNLFFYLFAVFTLLCKITAERNVVQHSEESEVITNLPSRNDLHIYLEIVERIIDFSKKHIDALDLNSYFGIFLTNVNLKPFLTNNALPESLRNHLKYLVSKNTELWDFKIKDQDYYEFMQKMKKTVFRNDTSWIWRLQRINKELPPLEASENEFHKLYPDWSKYLKYADSEKMVPSDRQSDYCLFALSKNEEKHSERFPRCRFIPKNCYEMLLSGSDIGYGLTHRILFLLQARHNSGCAIYSTTDDENIQTRLSEIMYHEAAYIADNDFKHPDLILEQIALAALTGHASILRRDWINTLIRYQTRYGCFSEDFYHKSVKHNELWILKQTHLLHHEDDPLLAKICSIHCTAVAEAAYSGAVRFILENY